MSVAPAQNAQQIEFVLGDAPRNHRALHGLVAAAGEPVEHAGAADAPAQAAHDFPIMHARGIDALAGRGLEGLEQLLARAQSADRAIEFAEAPWWRTDPGQILGGVADMGDFPVEHRTHAVAAEDHVAVAEVAMDQAVLREFGRRVLPQPAKGHFEHWPRYAQGLITVRQPRHD